MHNPVWIAHLFVVSLLVIVPILELYFDRRLKRFTSSKHRIAWYGLNIVVLCLLALAAVAAAHPLSIFVLAHQSAIAFSFSGHRLASLAAIALVGAYTMLTLGQGFRAAFDRSFRLRIAKAMRSMRFMLPVSERERRWWILVSLAAGFCEEILYRGFITQYFSGSLGATISIGTVGAWLLASVCFGLAHAYQGLSGVVRSGLGGLLLGAIAILSGGLWVPILLHFVFDLQTLWIYRPVVDEPDTAAQLIKGCDPCRL